MWYGEVEGTGIEVLDRRFNLCFAGHVRVERLWTGARWAEGPAWFAAGRYLIWSDIPNNRMMRLTDPGDQVSVFRERSNNSNGNTVDNEGRLVTCEHLTRRVTRTEIDGSITVLADKWEGKRLNSPNDAVVKSDDSVWFTDPAYGIDTDYEGDRQRQQIDGCHVYRIDPKSGAVDRVVSDMVRPNGIAFSPDEKSLYVGNWDPHAKLVKKYPVRSDGSLGAGIVFVDLTQSIPGDEALDGIKVDKLGHVYLSAPGGVWIFDAAGKHLGTIVAPSPVHNFAWGGPDGKTLYLCARSDLYRIPLLVEGVRP